MGSTEEDVEDTVPVALYLSPSFRTPVPCGLVWHKRTFFQGACSCLKFSEVLEPQLDHGVLEKGAADCLDHKR